MNEPRARNFDGKFETKKTGTTTPYTIILELEEKIKGLRRFNPHLTAISRKNASQPLRIALKKIGSIRGWKVLDFGTGTNKKDCELVELCGGICYNYDIKYQPLSKIQLIHTRRVTPTDPEGKFDLIICSYVLNVVTLAERQVITETLRKLINPDGIIIVGVREDKEAIDPSWILYQDGYITRHGTFQTFFSPKQGANLLEELFNLTVIRLGRGTYLVNKNK